MKTLCVLQHVESDYLGLLEDHFEARNLRFNYCRPFTPGGKVPAGPEGFDGLIVLGAGPLGIVSGQLVPSLAPELRLVAACLDAGVPVVGIGQGAILLATAAGGGAEEAPLRFAVETAHRTAPEALAGHLPERFPSAIYMRDRPVLPPGAEVLAASMSGEALVFRAGGKNVGFLGHPGLKPAIIEDLVMEFEDTPDNTAAGLEALRAAYPQMAGSLTELAVGLCKLTGWL